MAQVKIVAPREAIEKFKKTVLTKHGKLELSVEGEEALRLYIRKYEYLLHELLSPEDDPLKEIVGSGCSSERRNVLKDLERLEISSKTMKAIPCTWFLPRGGELILRESMA